jgi:hypothetical protein
MVVDSHEGQLSLIKSKLAKNQLEFALMSIDEQYFQIFSGPSMIMRFRIETVLTL